ncbi:MAG: molybdenum cofactor guanylyltransferase [Deltaproteobacteria bacterium]|nr:MAG: molybdenum cofactor guanylyltransferase [Deltaproteobacteria bacterium]
MTIMEEKGRSGQRRPYDYITGVILAGGSSKRYGQNKAFLEICGIRLIDRVTEEMKDIFKRLILVTNEKRDYEHLGIPIVEDLVKGLGPIGGIYTGLMSISDQAGFFVACDMPFISKQLIRYMVDIKDNHAAVVPLVANEIEPLHAIYAKSCLGPIRNLIDSRRYQIRLFYDQISVRYIKEDEIRKFCSPSRAFLNINTSDEFAKIQSLMKA